VEMVEVFFYLYLNLMGKLKLAFVVF